MIPRTLIVNAAKDAAELVSQLISKHTIAQTVKGKEDLRFLGLDLVEGSVVDNVKRGVLEPALSKVVLVHIPTVLTSNSYLTTHARAFSLNALVLDGLLSTKNLADECFALRHKMCVYVVAHGSQVKSLRFATEAAITILRIDDHIKINPKQAEDAHGHGH